MADPAVQKLRDAFADAPAGPVTLNSAFWSSAGLTPPVDFTAKIKAAYRLPGSADGLQITYDRGAVTPVSDDRFQVTGVSLTFLTAPTDSTTATIFGSPGTPETPTLGIDVVPAGWQLSDLFEAMTGFPFDLLKFDQQRFFYTTSDRQFTWSGTTLRFAAGQNLYGALPVPPAIQVLIQLVQNLPNPASVVMGGPIVLDKADNETVLFPDMDIAAPITGGSSLALFFIPVVNPRIGFVISTPPVVTAAADEADAEDVDSVIQNPYYFLGVDINLSAAPPVAMAVRALVSKDVTSYQFVISGVDSTNPITPASIVTLMAGGSYFDFRTAGAAGISGQRPDAGLQHRRTAQACTRHRLFDGNARQRPGSADQAVFRSHLRSDFRTESVLADLDDDGPAGFGKPAQSHQFAGFLHSVPDRLQDQGRQAWRTFQDRHRPGHEHRGKLRRHRFAR